MLEIIFSQILKMSLTAGVCIVVVSMLHLVFHRIPRKYLYALWIVVAFRLVCPVSVSISAVCPTLSMTLPKRQRWWIACSIM